MDSVLEIEEHALQAWPAAEVEACAGWELRAMGGVSRRANSVWTSRATGLLSVAERIAHAEAHPKGKQHARPAQEIAEIVRRKPA